MLAFWIILAAGVVLLGSYAESEKGMTLAVASIVVGYASALSIPIWFKRDHDRSQNRLLDRCRVLLVLGSRAVEEGRREAAEAFLTRIRRLERLWHYGSSIQYRVVLALWAIGCGVVASVLARFVCLLLAAGMKGGEVTANDFASELEFAIILSIAAPLHALLAYFTEWGNPDAIRNCGDRLWQILHGPKGLAASPKKKPKGRRKLAGLNPRQIFGLGNSYTRKELDKARRDLARALHPDLFQNISEDERAAREEELKNVNAAYDELLAGIR